MRIKKRVADPDGSWHGRFLAWQHFPRHPPHPPRQDDQEAHPKGQLKESRQTDRGQALYYIS